MPATYTADPTATQAPGPAPGPRAVPKSALPVDGDPPNSATFAQAYKEPVDHIAWLNDPYAISAQWGKEVRRYRNARLQERSRIGHGGIPQGRYDHWTENWTPRTPFSIGSLASTQIGKWQLQGVGAGGSLSPALPGVGTFNPSNLWTALGITVDPSGAGNRAEIRLADDSTQTLFSDDAYAYIEFEFALRTVVSMNWVVGLTTIGEAINGIAHGAFIIRPDVGGTNYKCRTINGGAPTEVDSGIAGTAGVLHYARIEWWGANVSDDSAARVNFFIDDLDTAVAQINLTLPNSAPHNLVPCFGGFSTGAVANATMFLGPVTYGQILRV
jgi:hypothetical protein